MPVAVDTINIARGVTSAIEDYRNLPEDFVADYVAPQTPTNTKQGFMPRFGRMNQKLIDFKVDPFAPSPRVDYNMTATAFNNEIHRGAANLPLELELWDDTNLLDANALGIKVDEALRIEREYALAVLMVNAGTFTNQSDPGDWTAAGGDPAGDINTIGKAAIHTATGKWAKYGLCSGDVALFLQKHVADLRAGGGSVAFAPLTEVAAYLGLKELRVAAVGYDSAKPGLASVAAYMYGTENFWLFHKPEQLNQFTATFMATTRYAAQSKARVWTVDDPEGLMIESKDCYDLVTVDETAAYYFHGLLS